MLMRLAIVCLVLGITADVHGQNKDIEKEIRSAYDANYDAIRQRDVDGAMKFFTSDYTEHLTSGVVLDYAGEVENTKEIDCALARALPDNLAVLVALDGLSHSPNSFRIASLSLCDPV